MERGEIVRRGDHVVVHWVLDENGLLDCELEVKGHAIGRRFKTGKMFTDQSAQNNFEGEEGEALAKTALDTAQAELKELEDTLGSRTAAEAAELKGRIGRKMEDLNTAYDADTRRTIAEEGSEIRREISKIKGRRENVSDVLNAEVESLVASFDMAIRPSASRAASEQFDILARQARDAIIRGEMEDARKSISEMRSIGFAEAGKQPGFIVSWFLELAKERHFAVDKNVHDRLVERGQACINGNNVDGVRMVIGQMLENRYPIDPKDSAAAALAGLMK